MSMKSRQISAGIRACLVAAAVAFLLSGCGKDVSVSFDSAEGLTKKQVEHTITEQTDAYGVDAENQADQIYDSAKEKGANGFDSLMETTENIMQGNVKSINLQTLTKNGLYYFLVAKQYLYSHFIKVMFVWWVTVILLALFFRLKNRATEKAILVVMGLGGTLALVIIVFSPI